jgi:hypothetical protein
MLNDFEYYQLNNLWWAKSTFKNQSVTQSGITKEIAHNKLVDLLKLLHTKIPIGDDGEWNDNLYYS